MLEVEIDILIEKYTQWLADTWVQARKDTYGIIIRDLEELKKQIKIELTDAQAELYSYLCMDASTVNAKEDMPGIQDHFRDLVMSMTDKECRARLDKEVS